MNQQNTRGSLIFNRGVMLKISLRIVILTDSLKENLLKDTLLNQDELITRINYFA